jgi:hypothetical protein
MRDGRMEASEERRLVLLAERLGIKASRAFELRDEGWTTPAAPSEGLPPRLPGSRRKDRGLT